MENRPSTRENAEKRYLFKDKKENTGDDVRASGTEEINDSLSDDFQDYEQCVHRYQTMLLRLIALLVALWLVFFVFLGVLAAPTNDMQPRIDAGDAVLFYRLDKDVQAQDVVVIEKEVDGAKQTILGRVVAVAGDTVEITDAGQLIVNGNAVVEYNISGVTRPYENSAVRYPLTLGADECFVLADTREGGMDSRYFGPVSKDELAGTAIAIWRRINL